MSEEQKAESPNYTSEVEVNKELKKINRGKNWAATASSMRQAKEEIHSEEVYSGEASTGKHDDKEQNPNYTDLTEVESVVEGQNDEVLAEDIQEFFKTASILRCTR